MGERLAYHWSEPEQDELPTNFPPGMAWIQGRSRGWIAFSLDTGMVDLEIRPRTLLDTQPSGYAQGGSGFGGHGTASNTVQSTHRATAGSRSYHQPSDHGHAPSSSTHPGFRFDAPPFYEFYRAGLTPGDTDRGIEWQLHNGTHYRAWRQSQMRFDDTAQPNLVVQRDENLTPRQYVLRRLGFRRCVAEGRISPHPHSSDEDDDYDEERPRIKSEDEDEDDGPRRYPTTRRIGSGNLAQAMGPATFQSQNRLPSSSSQRGRPAPRDLGHGRSTSPRARSRNSQPLNRFHISSHHHTQNPPTHPSTTRPSTSLTLPIDPPLPSGYTTPGYTPGHNTYRALDRSQRALGARPRNPAQGWQAGDDVIVVAGPSREEREGVFSWGRYGAPGLEMRRLIEPVEVRRRRVGRGEGRDRGDFGGEDWEGDEDEEMVEGEE